MLSWKEQAQSEGLCVEQSQRHLEEAGGSQGQRRLFFMQRGPELLKSLPKDVLGAIGPCWLKRLDKGVK